MATFWKLPPVMPAAFLLAGLIVRFTIWDARVLPDGVHWIAGGLVMLVAIGMFGWALASLRRRGESPAVHDAPMQVVMDGAYEWGRNPIYVSFLLLILGLGLLVNGWAVVLAVVPALAWLNWFVVAREERYLSERFADGYDVYRQRTHRWV